MNPDLCTHRGCRFPWSTETPRGPRCELHATAYVRPALAAPPPRAAPAPRATPPRAPRATAPRGPVAHPTARPQRTPAGRRIAYPHVALTAHDAPPGMCRGVRDGIVCDAVAHPRKRGTCSACYKLARRKGILDAIALPPVPLAEKLARSVASKRRRWVALAPGQSWQERRSGLVGVLVAVGGEWRVDCPGRRGRIAGEASIRRGWRLVSSQQES